MNSPLKNQIKALSNWKEQGLYLVRTIKSSNFIESLDLMQRIAPICEELNHHPEWTNIYNRLEIKLTTHDTGGISEKDIILAKKIDELVG